MCKIFRSRGIRFLKGEYTYKNKIYYEADKAILNNYSELKEIEKTGVLSFFEFSEDEEGNLDSLNFHNNLLQSNEILYEKLTSSQRCFIEHIPCVLGESYKNYTTGYRIKNNSIVGTSFYFYPTVWKKNRYGICGITDKCIIESAIEAFILSVFENDSECVAEIRWFSKLMNKYKGLSVSYNKTGECEYKLYAKLSKERVEKLKQSVTELSRCPECYGEVVLIAQRIKECEVIGYNLYFLE